MPLTPDGNQLTVASWASRAVDECCTPAACYDPCRAACNMVWSLPSGPMWDRQKESAVAKLETFNEAPWDLCQPLVPCPEDADQCVGLAGYAIFMAQYLADLINGTVWPAVRESDPFRATSTTAQWIKRYGWENCYQTLCRQAYRGSLSAYEIEGGCGPVYCPPALPDDLICAVDSGLVKSLARLQMGFIPNLAALNWVLEPLSVTVRAAAGTGDCCNPRFVVCPTDGLINACRGGDCWDRSKPQRIPACLDNSCNSEPGQPDIIWPAVVVAECIIRTFLPGCPDPLVPCTDPQWQSCARVAEELDWDNLPPEPEFTECASGSVENLRINPSSLCGDY